MKHWYELIKRIVDIVISFFVIIVLTPLFIIIAILIRIESKGLVFFRQKRLGKHGKEFTCLKFRSMYTDSPDLRNSDGSATTLMDDHRLTRIGRFLRKTSVDELPQLVNVLLGDMSLIGPRPDQIDQLHYYSGKEKMKLLVKPGITGLAQINGRNTISWEERKRLDLEYVENQSFMLDLNIFLRTFPYVLSRQDVFNMTYESDDDSKN